MSLSRSTCFIISFLFTILSFAQQKLAAGPMLGYVDMREACVWVQTSSPGNLTLEYEPEGTKHYIQHTETIAVTEKDAYTAHFVLTNLEPNTRYNYRIQSDDKKFVTPTYSLTTQPLWQWRSDPPTFRVATGSCAYINEEAYDRPGEPYGGDYYIFDTIVKKDPDLMLWLGDNGYLREADYSIHSGILHRFSHTRATPEMQKLLSHCANYAIWDDHDFGPNDSNGSYIHKDWTLDAFKMFWANPSYGLPGSEGITTQFTWGDIDFFLMDNRYNRTNPDVTLAEEPTILGQEQINWLIQALKTSRAPFKIIAMGGQFLNTAGGFETYATCPKEREQIIRLIEANNIRGVVFLSGDRHCAELSELKLSNGSVIYDLTVSPLTSKPYDITKEANTLRVDGTIVPKRNFATLDFTGKRGERTMTMSVYDSHGGVVWTKTVVQEKQN